MITARMSPIAAAVASTSSERAAPFWLRLLMAFILILPIPFANWPPGMTVAITSLALLQRDGVLMLLTIPAAIASVASVYVGTRVGLAVIDNIIEWGRGLFGG